MPNPTIDEACQALATVVASVTGINRAKAWADDQINPVEAQVYTRPFDPRLVFGKGDNYGPSTYLLGVRVFVSRNDMRTAQKQLRALMETTGTGSVLAAIEDGDSWAETIAYAEVTNIGQPTEYGIAGQDGAVTLYYVVDFDVDVVW